MSGPNLSEYFRNDAPSMFDDIVANATTTPAVSEFSYSLAPSSFCKKKILKLIQICIIFRCFSNERTQHSNGNKWRSAHFGTKCTLFQLI